MEVLFPPIMSVRLNVRARNESVDVFGCLERILEHNIFEHSAVKKIAESVSKS